MEATSNTVISLLSLSLSLLTLQPCSSKCTSDEPGSAQVPWWFTKSRFRQINGEVFKNDLRRQVPFNLKSWVHFVVKPQFCFCIFFFSPAPRSQPACGSWLFFLLWVSPVPGSNELLSPDGNCCPSMAAFVAPLAVEGEWLVSAPVVAEPCSLMCMVFHWNWSAKIWVLLISSVPCVLWVRWVCFCHWRAFKIIQVLPYLPGLLCKSPPCGSDLPVFSYMQCSLFVLIFFGNIH